MSQLISQALEIIHNEDPAVAIRRDLNDWLKTVKVGGQDVLLGVYKPAGESKTKGGVILTEKTLDEYDWQGITGLVLKMGPFAYKTEKTEGWFVDDSGNTSAPKVGDWVTFDVKQSQPMLVGKRTVRIVGCQYVLLCVGRPDTIA